MGGIAFLLAGAAIYYRSRLQEIIAQSSTEAELITMAESGKAALYIRSILAELGLIQLHPTKIDADKQPFTQTNSQSLKTKSNSLKQKAIHSNKE